MNDEVEHHKERLFQALAQVRAKREGMDRMRRKIRGRAVEQYESMDAVMGEAQKIREEDGDNVDVLTHRAHLGLCDERDRLQEVIGEAMPLGERRVMLQGGR